MERRNFFNSVSSGALFLVFAATSAFAPIAARAADKVEAIRQAGVVTVGTEAAYEPFEFIEDGKITGYSKQILDAVVADLGVDLNQLDLPWQGILPGVLAKKFDFVATSVSINAERAQKYAYTRPIGSVQTIVLVRSDNDDIHSAADLAGKVVATQLASAEQPVVEAYNVELKSETGTGFADLKLFQAFPETYVAVGSGQVDAALIGSNGAAALMRKQPDKFKIVGEVGEPRYLAWVTHPDDTDLRDYLNDVIGELADSGKLTEWQQEWFGFTMDLPSEGYLPEGAL
ncbi:transporter substrate-binding domain-containing protein [Defluviimonas sp. SAOS-178_SWC]|uniref:transporter substrate-binding domain-containing protein n=1 Tax=Defluviimonas sp. SAOS-178_SWC TaxID=3121287 RepID=UPI00322142D4